MSKKVLKKKRSTLKKRKYDSEPNIHKKRRTRLA